MSLMAPVLDPMRRAYLAAISGLRAPIPPVALEITAREVCLARTRRRRGRAHLEALATLPLAGGDWAASGRLQPEAIEAIAARVREAFGVTGTRPGKLSLVLPDNLAKVSLLALPERPSSARQLSEVVRFKLRRAVPFRLEDAVVSHQYLGGDGEDAVVLVAVAPRAAVEPFEKLVAALGARPGWVGLSTLMLVDAQRDALDAASAGAGDAALLNCTSGYFSLALVRRGRLIFFRCKSYGAAEEGETADMMARELTSSFSYYQEKLSGTGIGTAWVRTVTQPFVEIEATLGRLGVERVEAMDLDAVVTVPAALGIDPQTLGVAAAAVSAAAGGR
jgi:type IV pilus assembly protein PilM